MFSKIFKKDKDTQATPPADPAAVDQPEEVLKARHKSAAREWLESLVFALVFVFFFTRFIAQATQVPTESMKPTILVGDHFFLDKFAFPANYPDFMLRILPTREVKRGEIVAFKPPIDPNVPYIKRVIGLPGETLEVRDKVVYINGVKLNEPYVKFIDPDIIQRNSGYPAESVVRDNFGPYQIPPNAYFMMGDNRDNSYDSRFWGPVSAKEIIGRPLFIYWSYEADPYEKGPKPIIAYAREYGEMALHFFDKTRWTRMGRLLK